MADLTVPVGEHDHRQGRDDAPYVLVMYGDFECPYCAAAQGITRRVRKRLGDDLLLVFRHLPLSEVHPHAEHAAEASEAVEDFWAYHDALYAAQGHLEDRDLVATAKRLKLDGDAVEEALRTGVHRERVQRDLQSGLASGVQGTPGFFANGRMLGGAFDAGSIVAALRGE
jgi:protein-disulfide isomerase